MKLPNNDSCIIARVGDVHTEDGKVDCLDVLTSISGTWSSNDSGRLPAAVEFASTDEAQRIVERLHEQADQDYEVVILQVMRKFVLRGPTRPPLKEIK